MHACRTPQDFIFRERLQQLARDWPACNCGSTTARRTAVSTPARWRNGCRTIADFQARVCGPRGLVDAIEALYRQAGVAERVRSESYLGRVLPASAANDLAHRVHCSRH